jgi:hypothetical protein
MVASLSSRRTMQHLVTPASRHAAVRRGIGWALCGRPAAIGFRINTGSAYPFSAIETVSRASSISFHTASS